MERYYRVLLLLALIGIAIGLAGMILEQRLIVVGGCLVIPAVAYFVAVLIGFIRRE
jgi:hypothetical protein